MPGIEPGYRHTNSHAELHGFSLRISPGRLYRLSYIPFLARPRADLPRRSGSTRPQASGLLRQGFGQRAR